MWRWHEDLCIQTTVIDVVRHVTSMFRCSTQHQTKLVPTQCFRHSSRWRGTYDGNSTVYPRNPYIENILEDKPANTFSCFDLLAPAVESQPRATLCQGCNASSPFVGEWSESQGAHVRHTHIIWLGLLVFCAQVVHMSSPCYCLASWGGYFGQIWTRKWKWDSNLPRNRCSPVRVKKLQYGPCYTPGETNFETPEHHWVFRLAQVLHRGSHWVN